MLLRHGAAVQQPCRQPAQWGRARVRLFNPVVSARLGGLAASGAGSAGAGVAVSCCRGLERAPSLGPGMPVNLPCLSGCAGHRAGHIARAKPLSVYALTENDNAALLPVRGSKYPSPLLPCLAEAADRCCTMQDALLPLHPGSIKED